MGENSVAKRGAITPDGVFDADNEEVGLESYEGVQLTPAEVAFVDHYCDEGSSGRFNAAEAYRMAHPNVNWKHATVYGGRMAKKPHIMRAIQFRLENYGLSVQESMAELRNVALAPFSDLIDVKMRNGEIISTKMDLASKVRALEIIMRHYGALDNKAGNQTAVVVNINTPGLREEDLA
jgi:hypothetical protein